MAYKEIEVLKVEGGSDIPLYKGSSLREATTAVAADLRKAEAEIERKALASGRSVLDKKKSYKTK